MAKTTDLMTMRIRTGRPIKDYAKLILELTGMAEGHEMSLCRINWLAGKALNAARKGCKRGTWSTFLVSISMSKSQAHLLRKVATTVPESNSRKYKWTEMIEKVYPSFRKTIEAECEKDEIHPINSNNKRQRLPKGKKITIERLPKMLGSMMTTAQTLVDGKHLDSHLPPQETTDLLRDALSKIGATQKDLERIKRTIEKRIDNLSTGRKLKLRKAS